MVYTANWGIIWYLPPIEGTRKLHWFVFWMFSGLISDVYIYIHWNLFVLYFGDSTLKKEGLLQWTQGSFGFQRYIYIYIGRITFPKFNKWPPDFFMWTQKERIMFQTSLVRGNVKFTGVELFWTVFCGMTTGITLKFYTTSNGSQNGVNVYGNDMQIASQPSTFNLIVVILLLYMYIRIYKLRWTKYTVYS